MMNQQKSVKAGLQKYSLIVPLALAFVLSGNAQTVVNKVKNNLKTTTETKTTEGSTQKTIKSTVKFTPPVIENQKPANEKIYTVVEKMPEYPGGTKELLSYLTSTIKYPEVAKKNGIHGMVIVKFVVDEFGKVCRTEVLRGVSTEIDTEAIRVVNSMPAWTPGEQNGKKVAVYYTLPINFTLDGGIPAVISTLNGVGSKTSIKTTYPIIKRDTEVPLYIIDDKEVTKSVFDAIKPENIQSVNVLKNEAATKAYGDKGKNGVVVITLKK